MSRFLTFKNITIAIISFWLILFVLVPNTIIFLVSFMTRGQADFVKVAFTLENYTDLFNPVYLKIFIKTLKYSSITTLICFGIGYPFAWIISRYSPVRRSFLLVLIVIPFWTSSLIRTYALVIIIKGNGIINSCLFWLGIIDEPLQILYTDTAVYLGLVYALLPFMILPLYGSLEKIDVKLIDAAKDLGAGSFEIFQKVIIPLSMPGIVAGCIMVFLPSMGLFYITDLLGGAKAMLLGNFIKNQFLTSMNWPFGSAATVFISTLMLVVISMYYLSARKGHVSMVKD